MSDAYKCDRCGTFDDGAPQGRLTYTPKNHVAAWHMGKSGKELVLCMPCGIQFVDWFRKVLDQPKPDDAAGGLTSLPELEAP